LQDKDLYNTIFAPKSDYVPLAPHLLLLHYLNEETERELALLHGLALLRGADELWIVSDVISEGMQGEIEEAKRLGIPVRDMRELLPSAKDYKK
jgi:hypothetical protein